MYKKVLRVAITILGGAIGFWAWQIAKRIFAYFSLSMTSSWMFAAAIIALFAVVGFLLSNVLSEKIMAGCSKLVTWAKNKSFKELVSALAGFIIGLIIAFLVSQIFANISNEALVTSLNIIVYLFCAIVGTRIALAKHNDIELVANPVGIQTVLDTSSIIDGRICDILETGFVRGKIIVPKFIVDEVSALSDNQEESKRAKGRRGLDVLKMLKKNQNVLFDNTKYDKSIDKDELLIAFAKENRADIMTEDYGLNALASLQNIKILNINDLATALKISLVAGEKIEVFVLKAGKDPSQGVGYLEDGTMIVVENGARFIDKTVKCEVTSTLQTSSGKIIFVKITE